MHVKIDFQFRSAKRARFSVVTCSVLSALALVACAHHDDAPALKTVSSPETLYNYGIDALHAGRYKLASEQFEALQQNYPYSGYVGNAELMEGYAFYLQNAYPQAVQQLERYLLLHPTSPDAAYAYYLRALCFFEEIGTVDRDQQGTIEALGALQEVVTRYPETAYARDARLKIDLCRDHLAGKEMLVGRFYQKQRNYESAIGRYQRVVDDFQTTNHVPEALERLVEVNLQLGLTDDARKAASVLGYNYPRSRWYERAYDTLRYNGLITKEGTAPPKIERPNFFKRAWNWIF